MYKHLYNMTEFRCSVSFVSQYISMAKEEDSKWEDELVYEGYLVR